MKISKWYPVKKPPKFSGWYQIKFANDHKNYWRYYNAKRNEWSMNTDSCSLIAVSITVPKSFEDLELFTSTFGTQPGDKWRGIQ